jgi:hypothetical protein
MSFLSSTGFSDTRLFGKAREKSSKFAPAAVYGVVGQSQQKSGQKRRGNYVEKGQFLRCIHSSMTANLNGLGRLEDHRKNG